MIRYEKSPTAQNRQLMQTYPQLAWFTSDHLPPHLAMVSEAYAELAWWVARHLPTTPLVRDQVSKSLDRLLESKDAAVRGAVGRPEAKAEEEQVRGD